MRRFLGSLWCAALIGPAVISSACHASVVTLWDEETQTATQPSHHGDDRAALLDATG
jgi:hypothetical protein